MQVNNSYLVKPPKDRVIMAVDMSEPDDACWEFCLWHDEAHACPETGLPLGGWCIADHELLRHAQVHGEQNEVCAVVFDMPTHWAEVPALPELCQNSIDSPAVTMA